MRNRHRVQTLQDVVRSWEGGNSDERNGSRASDAEERLTSRLMLLARAHHDIFIMAIAPMDDLSKCATQPIEVVFGSPLLRAVEGAGAMRSQQSRQCST